jgi:hypothetical protein
MGGGGENHLGSWPKLSSLLRYEACACANSTAPTSDRDDFKTAIAAFDYLLLQFLSRKLSEGFHSANFT